MMNRNTSDMDDSDEEELENLDILRLQAALQSDHSETDSPTPLDLASVHAAIAVNKMAQEKLRKFESHLQQRLQEVRNKIKTLNDQKDKKQLRHFTYSRCAMPYFVDKDGLPAPLNEDAIKMKNCDMFDHYNNDGVALWTERDKKTLLDKILKDSRAMKKDQLKAEYTKAKLRTKGKINKEKLRKKYEKNIQAVNEMDLESLALPIDEEYDWVNIAEHIRQRHSASECSSMWKLVLHPSINNSDWTKKETVALFDIAQIYNFQNWKAIAKELNTGRTCYQCFVHYKTSSQHSEILNKSWSKHEEEFLERVVDAYQQGKYIPWNRIAAFLADKTKEQIHIKLAVKLKTNVRNGRFIPEEDSVIMSCAEKFGPDFNKIAQYLKGRNVYQIKHRYGCLHRINSVAWTVEEDKKLVKLMTTHPTYGCILNHFYNKTRINLRMRHSTLLRWMKANPNKSLEYAPRKSSFCLTNNLSQLKSIDKAVEELTMRLVEEYHNAGNNEIKKVTTYDEINRRLIDFFSREQMKSMDIKKEMDKGHETVKVIPQVNIPDALEKVLLLLRVKLNKEKLDKSMFKDEYKDTLKSGNLIVAKKKFRSYSKKANTQAEVQPSTVANIWGQTFPLSMNYVLPPSYTTIVGCQNILKYYASQTSCTRSLSALCKSNENMREEWGLYTKRFNFIFMWPLKLTRVVKPRQKLIQESAPLYANNYESGV